MLPRPHHPPLPRPDEVGGKTGPEVATGVELGGEADSPTMDYTSMSQQSKLGRVDKHFYSVGTQLTGLGMKNVDTTDKN